MPSHIRPILHGKRILLWKHLLKQHGYDDLEVVDGVVRGVNLIGSVGQIPSMTASFKPATRSVHDLKAS
jgi:hypothetical protein